MIVGNRDGEDGVTSGLSSTALSISFLEMIGHLSPVAGGNRHATQKRTVPVATRANGRRLAIANDVEL